MKILVVDDSKYFRDIHEEILKNEGYTLLTASDGVEGLEATMSYRPDLIISDILMPNMDGFEFCRTIKSSDELRGIPFVFCTATFTEEEDRKLAMDMGASRFIIKSASTLEFLEEINEVINELKENRLEIPHKPIGEGKSLGRMHSERVMGKLTKKMRLLEEEHNKLQKSEKRWKNIFEYTATGMIDCDDAYNIFSVNNAFCHMLGYSREELLGKNPMDLTYTEDVSKIGVPIKEITNGNLDSFHVEIRYVHKNGDLIWGSASVSAVRDRRGEILHIISQVEDITPRIKAQEEIKKLEPAVKQSPAIIIITDVKGRMEYVNPKFTDISGYSSKEVIGESMRILSSGKQAPEYYKQLWETISSGNEWSGEFHNRKKNGELFWVLASISPIKDSEGMITNYVSVQENITERKKMQELLIQSAKLASIGKLAANVAHEINNPMTSVIGYTSLLLDKEEKGSSTHKMLNIVKEESMRVSEIVQSLLDFSRQRKTSKNLLSVNELVADSINIINPVRKKSNTDINLDYGSDLPLINIDGNQIKQVFINIMSNAFYSIKGNGTLSIETKMCVIDEDLEKGDGKTLQIKFKDTGSGIEEGKLSRIFEPFFTTKGEKGTGLGLSVSYGIIKNHGGEILVESKEEVGSEFTVILPV